MDKFSGGNGNRLEFATLFLTDKSLYNYPLGTNRKIDREKIFNNAISFISGKVPVEEDTFHFLREKINGEDMLRYSDAFRLFQVSRNNPINADKDVDELFKGVMEHVNACNLCIADNIYRSSGQNNPSLKDLATQVHITTTQMQGNAFDYMNKNISSNDKLEDLRNSMKKFVPKMNNNTLPDQQQIYKEVVNMPTGFLGFGRKNRDKIIFGDKDNVDRPGQTSVQENLAKFYSTLKKSSDSTGHSIELQNNFANLARDMMRSMAVAQHSAGIKTVHALSNNQQNLAMYEALSRADTLLALFLSIKKAEESGLYVSDAQKKSYAVLKQNVLNSLSETMQSCQQLNNRSLSSAQEIEKRKRKRNSNIFKLVAIISTVILAIGAVVIPLCVNATEEVPDVTKDFQNKTNNLQDSVQNWEKEISDMGDTIPSFTPGTGQQDMKVLNSNGEWVTLSSGELTKADIYLAQQDPNLFIQGINGESYNSITTDPAYVQANNFFDTAYNSANTDMLQLQNATQTVVANLGALGVTGITAKEMNDFTISAIENVPNSIALSGNLADSLSQTNGLVDMAVKGNLTVAEATSGLNTLNKDISNVSKQLGGQYNDIQLPTKSQSNPNNVGIGFGIATLTAGAVGAVGAVVGVKQNSVKSIPEYNESYPEEYKINSELKFDSKINSELKFDSNSSNPERIDYSPLLTQRIEKTYLLQGSPNVGDNVTVTTVERPIDKSSQGENFQKRFVHKPRSETSAKSVAYSSRSSSSASSRGV